MKKHFSIVLGLCTLLLASCATTINVRVNRPAEIDLGNTKSIAIEPISLSSYLTRTEQSYARSMVEYLESNLERNLSYSNYYKIIGTKDRRTPADVYLECEIKSLEVEDVKKTEKIKNPNYKENLPSGTYEPQYINQVSYRRNIKFVFDYQYVDGYTNEILARKEFARDFQSQKVLDIKELPEPYDIMSDYLYSIVAQMAKEVQPYTVTKSLTLLEVKDNEDMKYADKLAERGYYKESYEKYMEVYRFTGLFEAGYNAAIVLEAQGNYYEARDLMKSLYLQTLNYKAERALADIEKEIEIQYLFQQQQNKRN